MRTKSWLGAALLLLGFGALAVLDAAEGTLRAGVVDQTIVWYLVAFAGFALAAWGNEEREIPVVWLWAVPVLLRLVMLTTSPSLSDDVYRYLWDGHLLSEGVNPYSYVINDPALDAYEIPVRALANNPDLSSPYLPTAHGVFGFAGLVFPSSPLTMQLIMVGFDLLVAALVLRLLKLAQLPTKRVLLYLWNPLVIVEIAHGAHLDALMMALTMAALVATFERRGGLSGPVLLALATLTRPLPVLVLPVLFWRWTWRQRAMFVIVAVCVVIPWGFGPGYGLTGEPTGSGVFGSARAYTEFFRFNSGIYHWLETWIGGRGLDDKGWNEPVALTRLVVGASVVVLIGGVWVKARSASSDSDVRRTLRLSAVAVGIYVLLTPVLHPWYTLLFFALLVFVAPAADEPVRRWLLLLPWFYLAATLIFSYLTYEDPQAFAEREWVRQLQWLPTLVLLAVSATVWVVSSRGTADELGTAQNR